MPPASESPQERLERVREPFLACLRSGASMAEASRTVGVPERTVQNWISRGGRQPGSVLSSFAEEVAVAREQVPAGPMDLGELREVVARAARSGSVQAMKLAWEMTRSTQEPAAGGDVLAAVDELAAARRAKQAEVA